MDEELDLNDDQKWQKARDRAATRAYDLGTVVAGEPHVIDELSQEFFTALGCEHLVEFGRGMASARAATCGLFGTGLWSAWRSLAMRRGIVASWRVYSGSFTSMMNRWHRRSLMKRCKIARLENLLWGCRCRFHWDLRALNAYTGHSTSITRRYGNSDSLLGIGRLTRSAKRTSGT